MGSYWRKLTVAALAGALSMGLSFAAMAMPADVGGTWNGYDSYEDWYFSEHGHYPPDDDGDDEYDVGEVTEVWWSGSTAKWDFDGHCRKFEVRLYRDGDHVHTVKTSRSRYSFSDQMSKEGDYTFEVRAIYGSRRSDWSDESDIHYTRGSGSHSSGHSSSSGSHAGGTVVAGGPGASTGGWVQAQDGTGRWWYQHSNGSYTANNWEQINGKWYFFDGSGWMQTGWIHWNGNTYYCLNDGSMVTGDVVIEGRGCHFNGSGALQ